jgi:diadenosine tetraphosphate (Ap4A) HIT family hydrolase
MNVRILGNAVPHLHCHIIPRFYGDPAPGKPLDPYGRRLTLAPEEYEQRLTLIRQGLSATLTVV